MYLIGISAIGVFTFVYFALLNTAIPAVAKAFAITIWGDRCTELPLAVEQHIADFGVNKYAGRRRSREKGYLPPPLPDGAAHREIAPSAVDPAAEFFLEGVRGAARDWLGSHLL